jgi:DnaJ-class molecular chaperone
MNVGPKRNWKQVLELEGPVNTEIIKKAFRTKTKIIHPDRSTNENATSLFQELRDAYESAIAEMAAAAVPAAAAAAAAAAPARRTETFISRNLPYIPGGARANLSIIAEVTLDKMYSGGSVMLEYEFLSLCRSCFQTGPFPECCSLCQGIGFTKPIGFHLFGVKECIACKSTGMAGRCSTCRGDRVIKSRKHLKFNFPAHFDFRKMPVIKEHGHERFEDGKIIKGDVALKISFSLNNYKVAFTESGDVFFMKTISLEESLKSESLSISLPTNLATTTTTTTTTTNDEIPKPITVIAITQTIKNNTLFAIPRKGIYADSWLYMLVKVDLPTRQMMKSGYQMLPMMRQDPFHNQQPDFPEVDFRMNRKDCPHWVASLISRLNQDAF